MKKICICGKEFESKQVKQDIVHKNAGLRNIIKNIKNYGIFIIIKIE